VMALRAEVTSAFVAPPALGGEGLHLGLDVVAGAAHLPCRLVLG
jgi:hypothetical protein